MRALIVDDDSLKAKWSKEEIARNYKDCEFLLASYGTKAKEILETTNIDLVILDMQFPYSQGEYCDTRCCLKVLDDMVSFDKKIPTIICSSGCWIRELNNYDNVVGFIRYLDDNASEKYNVLIQKHINI